MQRVAQILRCHLGATPAVHRRPLDTAAMHAIRAGGVLLVLEGGNGGTISKHPKAGVKQVAFGLADGSNHTTGLDVLARFFKRGQLRVHVQKVYALGEVPQAFTDSAAGDVLGKLAISTGTGNSSSLS